MEILTYCIGMAGTVAFAVTAVLALAPLRVDLFGATVLGIVTAIGGGTIRDVILDEPVFWACDLNYIWVAMGTSVAAFFAQTFFARKSIGSLMLYLDGLGAAMFGIEATEKVWELKFGIPLASIILGVITAIGGGLIRDVLASRQTLLMKRELYATTVLLGCVLFVILLASVPEYRIIGTILCVLLTFSIRAAAIRWKLSVPNWLLTRQSNCPSSEEDL